MPKKKTSGLRGNESWVVDPDILGLIQSNVQENFQSILTTLGIDTENDHNTKDTAARAAKMWVNELLRGRFSPPPKITTFDNVQNFDQLITVGPITVKSTCAHHLMPFVGDAFIGILPGPKGKLIGLSKCSRIVEYFSRRLQIQEELTKQITHFLVETLKPKAILVRLDCQHFCMTHRGVEEHDTRMVTTEIHGDGYGSLKQEFLAECHSLTARKGSA